MTKWERAWAAQWDLWDPNSAGADRQCRGVHPLRILRRFGTLGDEVARIRANRAAVSHRIAIVDDDADLLEATQQLLVGEGHVVETALDATSGVELVREFKPDLLLLDYYLDRATGGDLVRAIREFDTTVQVLLVTGYASEQPARRLLAELDIQGFHDKADGAERLLVLVDSALKHHRALEKIRRQQQYLRRILAFAPALARLQQPRELLEAALHGLIDILDGKEWLVATTNSGLFVLSDANEALSVHAGTGEYARVNRFSSLPPPTVDVIRGALTLERPTTHPDSWVLLPLSATDGARGCMALQNASLPAEAVDAAELYARLVVQAFENVRLYQRATIDALTQLYQRAFGMQRLEETLRLGNRVNTPTAVLMLDVDHFKTVNDTHGHPAGDLALRMISRAVIASCRTTDVAVRYGGEEIMVVLPGTAGAGAMVVAERIRKSIEELQLEYEGAQIRCTGSIGVAWSGPDSIDFASLVRRADEALFEAKNRGRNRVSLAADPAATA